MWEQRLQDFLRELSKHPLFRKHFRHLLKAGLISCAAAAVAVALATSFVVATAQPPRTAQAEPTTPDELPIPTRLASNPYGELLPNLQKELQGDAQSDPLPEESTPLENPSESAAAPIDSGTSEKEQAPQQKASTNSSTNANSSTPCPPEAPVKRYGVCYRHASPSGPQRGTSSAENRAARAGGHATAHPIAQHKTPGRTSPSKKNSALAAHSAKPSSISSKARHPASEKSSPPASTHEGHFAKEAKEQPTHKQQHTPRESSTSSNAAHPAATGGGGKTGPLSSSVVRLQRQQTELLAPPTTPLPVTPAALEGRPASLSYTSANSTMAGNAASCARRPISKPGGSAR